MSVWFEFRLIDWQRFEAARADLTALARGEVTSATRELARRARDRLASLDPRRIEDWRRASFEEGLTSVVDAVGDRLEERERFNGEGAYAIVALECMVDYEKVRDLDDAPSTAIRLADSDGALWAGLTGAIPLLEQWVMLGPPGMALCGDERGLLVLPRTRLETLAADVERLALEDPELEEMDAALASWGRFDVEIARLAFARLRALVSRAAGDPRWSLSFESV